MSLWSWLKSLRPAAPHPDSLALADEMMATVACVQRLNALMQAGAANPTRAQRILFLAYCDAVAKLDMTQPTAARRVLDGLRTLTYRMAPCGEGN